MIPSPEVEAVAVVDDLALLLIATLGAFGITFTAAGGIDDVGPWVVDKFEEFVDSAGETLSSVVDQMRYGVNKAGDLIGNAYALSFNARFAQWLETEYSLTDNDSSLIVSGSSYLPYSSSPSYSSIVQSDAFYSVQNQNYVVRIISNKPNVRLGFISSNAFDIEYFIFISPYDFFTYAVFDGSPQITNVYSNSVNTSFSSLPELPLTYSSLPIVKSYYFDSTSSLYYFFVPATSGDRLPSSLAYSSSPSVLYSTLLRSPDITINTGAIDIPQVGDYSNDDGILIYGIGSWGDTLQDILDKVSGLTVPESAWPTVTWGAELADQLVDALVSAGELTTENSPGYFNGLPGSIPDINFGGLWHYVTDWVGSMSAGLSLIGGIMFSLPFVAAFYAVVVILLVLSLWRLLRSA